MTTINSKSFNGNCRMKVYGKGLNTLLGFAGSVALLGMELLSRLFMKFIASGMDKLVVKLRRGIKITFYAK